MRRLGRKPFILIDQVTLCLSSGPALPVLFLLSCPDPSRPDLCLQDAVRTETAKLVQSLQPARLRLMLSRKPAKKYCGLAKATENCGYKDSSRS